MKAYHIESYGAVEGLVLRTHDDPTPEPHEVVVRVRATALNRRDLMILDGTYAFPGTPDVIPISDGAGEVVAVGASVRRVAMGDRVAGTYFARWADGRLSPELAREQLGCTLDGMLTEYAVLHEEWLVHVPPHLSWEEAATLPCAALTAWSALTGPRAVIAGETVLTLGSGGVALFAVQFAKVFGARVIAVTSSDEKGERLKKLGADAVINWRETPDWERVVREITDNRGADHVVEAVGPPTLERSIKSASADGQIALMGVFEGNGAMFDPRTLSGRLVTIRRIAVGSRAGFEAMNRAIALHQLRPVISRAFAFGEAKEAYRHFARGGHVGKVVICGA